MIWDCKTFHTQIWTESTTNLFTITCKKVRKDLSLHAIILVTPKAEFSLSSFRVFSETNNWRLLWQDPTYRRETCSLCACQASVGSFISNMCDLLMLFSHFLLLPSYWAQVQWGRDCDLSCSKGREELSWIFCCDIRGKFSQFTLFSQQSPALSMYQSFGWYWNSLNCHSSSKATNKLRWKVIICS